MQQKSELPEGWAITSIGEICFVSDRNHTTPKYQETGYPLISPKVFRKNGVDFSSSNLKYVGNDELIAFEKKCNPEREDILYSRIGTIGEARLLDFNKKFVALHSIALIKPTIELKKTKIVYYFLQSELAKKQAFDGIKSIGVPDLGLNKLNTMSILLPPLPEQHRIVSAIKALFARLDVTNEKLDRVPEVLKKFRQSVLAAACEGRLTEEWRKENQEIGNSDELIKKVSANRFDIWKEQGSLKKKYTVPQEVDTPDLPPLPKSWVWTTLDQVVQEGRPIIYGIIKPGPDIPDGVPYVRVNEMASGKISDISKLKRASMEIAKRFSRATLLSGDLLISKDGTIGKVAIVPSELEGGNINQHIVRATIHPFIDKNYVVNSIRSPRSQKWLDGEKKGVALQGVNVEDFRRLPLPLPPLPEQQEIVRRVDTLFAFADSIEAKVAAAREKTEKLRQSILAKAFSGELVETEAEIARREGRDYETAEVLIERIKVEKGKNERKR